ncbi:nuclear transport factor 2 family protein [Conservatibacter flavescens]|uniref:Polyketide cyclase n=1 Tax=Conservatibacter flavescens TaxID=28161 RepID=A0A2M8S333_9PAST|nr:ester cyclase [Conservatibacter flavescens]PJG85508.1 polyketide cyclase [Conservatibacter flavescens]
MKFKTILATTLLASLLAACSTTSKSQLEEANRKVAIGFYQDVFINKNIDAVSKYIGETYIQHNPSLPDGRDILIESLAQRFQQEPERSNQILRTAVEGDLVWLHALAKKNPQDRGRVLVDIYRIKDGKIVEHWDVIQAIPEKSANNNTMY